MSGGPLVSVITSETMLWGAEEIRVEGIAWYWNAETNCVRVIPFGEWFLAAQSIS